MGLRSMKGWMEVISAAVVAVLLSFLSIPVGEFVLVLTIIPLVFISLRRGLLLGLFAGALTGILIYVFNSGNGEVAENIVMYFGPSAFVGISGFFAKYTQRTLNNKRFSNAALNIVTASFFGSLIYFIWLFIGSLSFKEEVTHTWEHYLQLDGMSMLLTFAVTTVVLLILAKIVPKSLIPKDTPFLSRKEKSRLLND